MIRRNLGHCVVTGLIEHPQIWHCQVKIVGVMFIAPKLICPVDVLRAASRWNAKNAKVLRITSKVLYNIVQKSMEAVDAGMKERLVWFFLMVTKQTQAFAFNEIA